MSYKPKVLIVDDAPKNIQLLGSILRTENYDISYTTKGKEAVKWGKENDYDLILLDVMMPEMNGFDVCNRLQNSPQTKDIPVIFLTAKSDKESIVHGLSLGAKDYVSKPFNKEELKARVKNHLELKLARDELRRINSDLEKEVNKRTLEARQQMELKEKTTNASVSILSEVLSYSNSIAFSRSSSIRRYVEFIADRISPDNKWEFILAATLSQIGTIAIPQDLLIKVSSGESLSEDESDVFDRHPKIARRLLAKIPGMQSIAYMIGGQLKSFREYTEMDNYKQTPISLGAQMLKVSLDFEIQLKSGKFPSDAIQYMKSLYKEYNPMLLEILKDIPVQRSKFRRKQINVQDLHIYMMIDEDVKAKNGITIIPKDQDVTFTMIELLKSFKQGIGVREPFWVKEFF